MAKNVPHGPTYKLPFLARIPAGPLEEVTRESDELIEVAQEDFAADRFIVGVHGDSLQPLAVNGQRVLMQPLPAPVVLPARSGAEVKRAPADFKPLLPLQSHIHIVCVNGECGLKKIVVEPITTRDWKLFVAAVNPALPRREIKSEDEVRVTARALKILGQNL